MESIHIDVIAGFSIPFKSDENFQILNLTELMMFVKKYPTETTAKTILKLNIFVNNRFL